MYNLTISAADPQGSMGFASFVVYLNITTIRNSQNSFECSLYGARSEINTADGVTLMPTLYNQVTI